MGASGVLDLVSASETSVNSTEPSFGGTTGQTYTYSIDLTVSGSLVLTGDFDIESPFDSESSFSVFSTSALGVPGPVPGTFFIDPSNGTFTYSVTLAEVVNAGGDGNYRINIEGQGASFSSDVDVLSFNFTVCFAAGTGISTPQGETAVEALQIGDMVRTADGRDVPVKWMGHVTVNPMFNPADRLSPVLIRKGAFGDTPTKDLIVTADHGMIFYPPSSDAVEEMNKDGMIVNASALVNGDTISWYDWKQLGANITYYHVETEAHDVILANGATTETFLDVPGRQSFDNYAEYITLYGAETPIQEAQMPRISTARLVPEHIKRSLAAIRAA